MTSATRVDASHDAIEEVFGAGPTAIVHDQQIVLADTRLMAEYGVTDYFALGLTLPFRLMSSRVRYLADDVPVTLVRPIHHQNETRIGLGDIWLTGRLALRRARWSFGLRAGLSLPTGITESDPFRLGAQGLPHQHFQLGAGVISPLLGLDIERQFTNFSVALFGFAQPTLHENAKGYRPGSRLSTGLSIGSALGTKRWDFRVSGELSIQSEDRWHGVVYADEANQGRTDLLAGASVGYRLAERLRLSAGVKVPIATRVSGGSLSYPFIAELGLSWSVGPGRQPDSAVLGPLEKTDWSGLDMQELTNSGEAVALAPTPHKITVFDFWAKWCKPCKVLDQALRDLSRQHPGALAVRKIEVPAWDRPAARRYLTPKGFSLPHLKVLSPDGRLLLEQSGSPHQLSAALVAVAFPDEAHTPTVRAPAAGARRIVIKVSVKGYAPDRIVARPGEELALIFQRKGPVGCADDLSIPLGSAPLAVPDGRDLVVGITAPRTGSLRFGCSMAMVLGEIVVP